MVSRRSSTNVNILVLADNFSNFVVIQLQLYDANVFIRGFDALSRYVIIFKESSLFRNHIKVPQITASR